MFLFLQLAGAFIVIHTCAITGICWGAKTTYRIEELEHIQRAMTMLQSDIDFLAMPLPDALEEIGKKSYYIIANLFLKVANEMEKRKQEGGEEIWKQEVLRWENTTYLEKQDIDAMIHFGTSIGYLDIEQQKASIALLLHYIETTLTQLQQKNKQQQKLYTSMGILGGMFIVVILL